MDTSNSVIQPPAARGRIRSQGDQHGLRFVLPSGRGLGYDDHGPAEGQPVFYFHGVPSSRLDLHQFASEALAERLGIRVIAVDRPGCGRSDFQSGRTIADWPADVATLADGLGIERFAALGWSGGGPYALACARALPQRVSTAALVSSVGPHDVPGLTDAMSRESLRFFDLNRDRPRIGRLIDRLMPCRARFFAGEGHISLIGAHTRPARRLAPTARRGEITPTLTLGR